MDLQAILTLVNDALQVNPQDGFAERLGRLVRAMETIKALVEAAPSVAAPTPSAPASKSQGDKNGG